MVANLPVVTIYDIWFQNAAIGIPWFLIMADMKIRVRAIYSCIQTHNLQQDALVVEHCITASIIVPIPLHQRHEITRVKRYYQDVIPRKARYLPDEF